jgi:predicted DNA-binding transcriptional regulator AlpA
VQSVAKKRLEFAVVLSRNCPEVVRSALEKRPMPGSQPSSKSFVTVSEMAEMCLLSRSRFYALIESGVFPRPVQLPSSKRPMYDRGLQEKCLEIRQTGIGVNGQPVLFNRKPTKVGPHQAKRKTEGKASDYEGLVEPLKQLGLSTSAQAIAEALMVLFPTGYADLDQGDVIRKVFLYLQRGHK